MSGLGKKELAIQAYERAARAAFDESMPPVYWLRIQEALERNGIGPISITDLNFLDIAGGSDVDSIGGYHPFGESTYDPYLCRYIAALGANTVVNVDAGPLNPNFQDVFKHVQLTLSEDPKFSLPQELKNRGVRVKFHIIWSAKFADDAFASTSLLAMGMTPSRLYKRIQEWACDLLLPGGCLITHTGERGFMLDEQGLLVPFRSLGSRL